MNDAVFMALALEQAREAAAAGEIPVGAIVVRQGKVIAVGRNAPIAMHDPTAHAEMVALRSAALVLGNYRLDECELFVTLEPCAMCSGAMLQARLKRVIFGALEPKTGAAGSVINLFAQPRLNHQTEVQGGVLASLSQALLQDFFRRRRAEQREASKRHAPLRDDALRTPDAAFQRLAGYPWPPNYINDLPALDGLRLHYLDEGGQSQESGSPKTFLCLHGNQTWSYFYRRMISGLLAAGHRAVAPDLVGFGKSDKPKKACFHTFARHRAILLELVERLDLQNIVLVVQTASDLLSLSLPMSAPCRYQSLWIMNTPQASGVMIQPNNFLAKCAISAMPAQVDGVSMQADAAFLMSVEEYEAYQAPFPDRGHRIALSAFPSCEGAGNTELVQEIQEFWQKEWKGTIYNTA